MHNFGSKNNFIMSGKCSISTHFPEDLGKLMLIYKLLLLASTKCTAFWYFTFVVVLLCLTPFPQFSKKPAHSRLLCLLCFYREFGGNNRELYCGRVQ